MGPLSRLLVVGALSGLSACGDHVDADPPPPPPTGIPSAAFEAKGPVVGPSRALGAAPPVVDPWDNHGPLSPPPTVVPTPPVVPPPPAPGPGANGVEL